MTHIGTKEIDLIVAHNFALDFLDAALIQQTGEEARTYRGAGSISQTPDGALALKLYCPQDTPPSAAEQLSFMQADDLEPGKIIGTDKYFRFEGSDQYGQSWAATDIWLDVHVTDAGRIIHSNVRSLESVGPSSAKSRSWKLFFVPGKYKVPFTGPAADPAEPGFSACTIKFDDGSQCEIHTRRDALVVEVSSDAADEVSAFADLVLEGVGVAIGAELVPQVEIMSCDGQRRQTIRRVDHGASFRHRLLPPIPVEHPGCFPDFCDFVRRYIEYVGKPRSQLAGFWHRVLVGFQSGAENQALVLTTAIEGVLKAAFRTEGSPDQDFTMQIDEAVTAIGTLSAIGSRARERILSTLANAKAPTANNALHHLRESGRVSSDLVATWKKLRNKSAHADELTWSPAQMQVFVDELYSCLDLFYRLIMLKTGYGGKARRFSKPGWPEETFVIAPPANSGSDSGAVGS